MRTDRTKHTPIGFVPENWELKRLSSLATISYGISKPLDKNLQDGIPIIGMPNVPKDGRFKWQDNFFIQRDRVKDSDYLRPLDILFNWRSGSKDHLGKTALFNFSGRFTHVGFLLRIRCGKQVIPQYCDYYIKGIKERGYFLKAKMQVNNTFNKEELSGLPIVLPPLVEQKKIVAVLGTWDEAIEKTEKLIEAKQKLKKGLCQQLLTGNKRFKEFEGHEWEYHKAGDLFKSYSQKNNDEEVLLSVTQNRGVIPRDMLEGKVVMPDGSTRGYKLVTPGDFVISLRSFQGGLEYSTYRGIVSPAYTVLKPQKDICESFYRHYFKSYDFVGHLAVAVIGIRDGKQVSYDDFAFLKLPYPPIKEQWRISDVLDHCDKEIEIITRKLEALKRQKKGLMQKLLTGKIRVRV